MTHSQAVHPEPTASSEERHAEGLTADDMVNYAARAAVALVWLYEGLWCKLAHGRPNHFYIAESMPGFTNLIAWVVLGYIGAIESVYAGWVLLGRMPRLAAVAQSALLIAMNTAGLLYARQHIPDLGGMIVHNLAFLALIWLAALQTHARARQRKEAGHARC